MELESPTVLDIPDNLFYGVAPKLTYIRLYNCGIGWQSPLLKGLRVLELLSIPECAQIAFYSWLHALKQLRKLWMKLFIKWVGRNALGPQETEALQSLFIGDNKERVDIFHGPCPGRIPMMSCAVQLTPTCPTGLALRA